MLLEVLIVAAARFMALDIFEVQVGIGGEYASGLAWFVPNRLGVC